MNKILIIDDEPTIRMLLSRILELEGYEVLKAKDRATALYTLKKQAVQVVLCDVFLPDGNGVDMVEEANHGTVFLDEIGEMALELQSKLLRVLETGEFVKVGDTKTTHVDVRILSATNRNLKEEIANGRLREDLYFRLSVFRILLPPLRQRRDDIPLLAQHFIEQYARQIGRTAPSISTEAKKIFLAYPWPGNVREMMNAIEHGLIVCESDITPGDLPIDMLTSEAPSESDDSLDLKSVERNHIIKVLHHTHGNKTETARLLKIGLTTLYRKIEEYGITV